MLKGIFPVVPTLFTEDDSLDLDAQRKVIRFALDAGAHGLVFPGVASEYNYLTSEERGELIALTVEEVDQRVPIVGGASGPTTEAVIAAGRQAQHVGINHLMIMAPTSLGKEVDAHHEFLATVSAELPDARIILQNAPAPIGAGLSAAMLVSLAGSIPSVSYVKEETLPSGPAITALRTAEIDHLAGVFGGGGARYIIDELNRGTLGGMPAVELTSLHVAIYEAHVQGNRKRARELYRLSLPLLVCQAVYRMRLTKYVLARRGVAGSQRVRAPLPELDEHGQRDVDDMLQDLDAQFP